MKNFITKRKIVLTLVFIQGMITGGFIGAVVFALQDPLHRDILWNLKFGFTVGSLGVGLLIGGMSAEWISKKIS